MVQHIYSTISLN